MEKAINLGIEKYLDTDIDELVIKFSQDKNRPSSFDTIAISEDTKSIISYESYNDTNEYCWIAIANPLELQYFGHQL